MATRQLNLTADELLTNIYHAMRGITLTKNQAAAIVGGRYRLERLVLKEKKIRMRKPHDKQNSQWKCNGEDVIRYAKNNFIEM